MILQERRFNSSTNTTTYIRYIYDETGVVGFKTGTDINNLTTYYFVKNMQNDIVEIMDTNLNSVVKYTYDAYGNVFISGTLSSTIGELNPYRYRGYYYDNETKTYYCNSRYYSSELCRFISPDNIEYLDPQSINGLNLYCYCVNNPVMYVDSSGNFPVIAFIIGGIAVGAVVSVIVVLGVKSCTSEKNPSKENDKIKNSEGKKNDDLLADFSEVIMPEYNSKSVANSFNNYITNDIVHYPNNSLPIQPHGAGGYEIPNGNYNSYSGGRAVFDSTYEEDLFDVILSLKIWG